MVDRSVLAIKLLTYEETGAIIAAPTFGIPDDEGIARDFRFSWIRDASFAVYALLRVGFKEEAASYMKFLTERARQTMPHYAQDSKSPPLLPLYTIDGTLQEVHAF
jgi:GH15 family glucan-1,4-alpha-glucosidase